ncbi:hypothetical protein D3C81_1249500 [compost metagenome]
MSNVFDNSQDVKNVNAIPRIAMKITANMATEPDHLAGTKIPKKRLAIKICVGHLPLHSEKLLVMIAINFSRGLLIILVATTPAALQPKPILMVSACLP